MEDPLVAALKPVLRKYRDSRERRESHELLKAIRLAPSLDVCEALLRGQEVPRSKMDERWLRAYRM